MSADMLLNILAGLGLLAGAGALAFVGYLHVQNKKALAEDAPEGSAVLDKHNILLILIGLGLIALFGAIAFTLHLTTAQQATQPQQTAQKSQSPAPVEREDRAHMPNGAIPWDRVIEELQLQNPTINTLETPQEGAVTTQLGISKPEPVTTDNATEAASTPRWQRNASKVALEPGKKPVVIVLDDMGVNVSQSEKALDLPPEITLAFIPYGRGTAKQAAKARKQGHEIMVHIPMEPMPRVEEAAADPGPNALYVGMPQNVLDQLVRQNLEGLEAIAVGANNHMGSRFTADKVGMSTVLNIMNEKQMFFLDSLTTADSAVAEAKGDMTFPLLTRDVFLDHYMDMKHLEEALTKVERVAQEQGHAIAIGHPHTNTIEALKAWIPTLEEKNLQLVPVTALINPKETPDEPSVQLPN